MCPGIQGNGELHIFSIFGYIGWEMVHRHPSSLDVRAGGGCLVEVAGKQNDFLWGKSWVEWANRPAERETQHFPRPLWKEDSVGCSEKGIAVQDSGVSSAAEQTIYQDLGDRCLKEKKIFA